VYKKIRNVDTERVELELEEYRHKQLRLGGLDKEKEKEKEKETSRKKNSNVKRLGTKLVLKGTNDKDVEGSKETNKEKEAEIVADVGQKNDMESGKEKAVVEPLLENKDVSNVVDSLPIPIKKKRLTLKKRLGDN
jgi:hypothetical protein